MLTNAHEERMVIVSDAHIGNPFCSSRQSLIDFISKAGQAGFSVCINGDGIDVAQSNFTNIIRDIPDLIRALKKTRERGHSVYYVIGNHDIALEHIMHDWEFAILSPFLNIRSGGKRIRIEHGHLYDEMFIKRPELYEFLTKLAGYVLKVNPNFYKVWHKLEQIAYKADTLVEGIHGEPESFCRAADEILKRGFDSVIFGHTHHPGLIDKGAGKAYVNSGTWMVKPTYVKIISGEVSLHTWDGNPL